MTNPTPHGQVPDALRLAEEITNLECSSEAVAKTIAAAADELCRLHVENASLRAVLAKWGTQPQAGAVPQRWKAVPVNPTPEMWKAAKTVPDPNPPYPPHYGLVWDAMLAASPTPPAEKQAKLGAVYAELPKRRRQFLCTKCGSRECKVGTINEQHPPCECGYLGFAEDLDFNADEMRDFADRTHALRMQQAAPKAAPQQESTASNESAYQRGYMDGMAKGRRDAETAPQPAPAPLSEMPYEKRKAIQEGEQIGASDAWFKARHEMLDTVDRRNVFRAGFDRGWNAALAAQGGRDALLF